MDPVSLVVTALALGAAGGVKDTAAQAVKDAYAGFKALVLRKVQDQPGATVAVEQHATDPATWQAPVTKALTESGAGDDPQVVQLAQQLLALVDAEGAKAGKYVVDVRDSQGTIIGDSNTVTQSFADTTITAAGERSVAAHTISGNVSTGDTPPGG